jgi:glycolate oxidase
MSVHQAVPDVVVFVESVEQVQEVVRIAAEHGVPLVARGAGSSVTGAVIASKGGIVMNMGRMNAIKQINLEDGYVVCEPGVICNDLNSSLGNTHFFPPDPGSAPVATVGGMVSTNASGVRAVKYGTARDYCMALEVVLADGSVIRTGTKAPKSSSGYDLTRLFCTAEGTLGIITELTLKILPRPEFSAFGQLHFPSITEAGACVRELFAAGVPISTCEILDGCSINAVKQAMNLDIPQGVSCLLFMEIDGEESSVNKAVERITETMKRHGGMRNEWSSDPQKRAAIWSARHGLVAALNRLNPGRRQAIVMEDFGVPMSRIPETITDIQAISKRLGIEIATFGHIGDGNLHPVVLINPYDQNDWDMTREIAGEFVKIALRYEGTLTAEHGVGLAKSPLLKTEHGEGLRVMQAIKDALDPKDILNPGKLGLRGSPTDIFDYSGFVGLVRDQERKNSLGDDVDREVLACSQCGFCTINCPTYAAMGREALNARGRQALSFSLLNGDELPSEEMGELIYRCTLCDNCAATCPAGVKTSKVVQAVRSRLYAAGKSPDAFNVAFRSIREYGNPFMQPVEKRTDIFDEIPALNADTEILYWPGCVSSYQELKVVPAMVKVLNKLGVKWSALGQEEGCCGYLAYVAGAMDVFEELVRKNMQVFQEKGNKTIVTTCPGCAKAFRDVYPKHGGAGLNVLHATEYFSQLIREGRISFGAESEKGMRVAYHDPCDLGRHLGVYDAPREILAALPDIELVEFPHNRERAKCCGAGGGMKGMDLELSNKLADSRVLSAQELGVDAIVSACASCKQNLTQATARLKKDKRLLSRIKVLDIMELFVKSIA